MLVENVESHLSSSVNWGWSKREEEEMEEELEEELEEEGEEEEKQEEEEIGEEGNWEPGGSHSLSETSEGLLQVRE